MSRRRSSSLLSRLVVMELISSGWVRRMFRQVHLWIGLGLSLLIAAIALSGALLVFGPEVDRLIDPSRYAVTGAAAEQAAGVYLGNAAKAAPGAQAAVLRWPEAEGAPVTVLLRGGAETPAAPRDRLRIAYLDPPTGRVLGLVDARATLVGIAHALHANLLVPQFSGRQIVGWVGVGLLMMTLTGLWLWWPRNSGFLQALAWRRGATASVNLHNTLGVWIALPLAAMALTGMSLCFPEQARGLIGLFADLAPQGQRPGAGQGPGAALMLRPAQDPQRVVEIALQSGQGLRPAALSAPTDKAKVWRVQLLTQEGERRSVLVDDQTLAATHPPTAAGDAFAAWLRRVHEATHHGPLWQAIGFLSGALPAVLLVTGVLMWLRRRSRRAGKSAVSDEKIAAPLGVCRDL